MNQIADIVDAIYKGAFKSGKLVNSSGKRIRPVTGHGLFYYNSSQEAVFDEMFANYCALRKNNEIGVTYYIDPVKGPIDNGIECLRAIVGDELVDYLEDFYQQKIVKSDSSLIARSR